MWHRLSFRFFLLVAGCLVLAGGILIVIADRAVSRFANPFCYDSVDAIPANQVGLLLGTGKFTRSGKVNEHYTYRLDACEKLFRAGKIQFVLVSGDNSRRSYDEPTAFKQDLVTCGIPAEKIYLDYAGFRTLDSVVRAREIFGLTHFTVISQRFHNQRAIYLARKKGIEAIGFNAQDATAFNGFKTKLREKFARAAAFCDLYLFHTKPKFLGQQIAIGEATPATAQ